MGMMVCVKPVIDLEEPPTTFKISSNTKDVILTPEFSPITGLSGNDAAETALRIKNCLSGEGREVRMNSKITQGSLSSLQLFDMLTNPGKFQKKNAKGRRKK